jgi:hypothetical protein
MLGVKHEKNFVRAAACITAGSSFGGGCVSRLPE